MTGIMQIIVLICIPPCMPVFAIFYRGQEEGHF